MSETSAFGATASEPPPKRQKLSTPSPSTSLQPNNLSSTTNVPSESSNEPTKMEVDGVNAPITDLSGRNEREIEVGITQFVNLINPGFKGVLKQRYTDFIVNEVAPDGTVIHLLDDKVPKLSQIPYANQKENRDFQNNSSGTQVKVAPEVKSNGHVSPPNSTPAEAHVADNVSNVASDPGMVTSITSPFKISSEDEELLVTYFGVDLKDQVLLMNEKIISKPHSKPSAFGSLLSEAFTDRQLRGKVHHDMRRIFDSRFETEHSEGGKIRITAAQPKKQQSEASKGRLDIPSSNQYRNQVQRHPRNTKIDYTQLGGQYLHFTMHKENKDTMEVLVHASRSLKVKPGVFSFAGTKDRRAVTVQRVSIFRQDAANVAKLNSTLKPGSRFGDFKYEKFGLELGYLQGNLFRITLRDCHFGEDDALDINARLATANKIVGQAIEHIQHHGFINYFGLQRFGTFGIGTDTMGKFILQDDFEGAVKALLTYSPSSLTEGEEATDRVGRDDIARARAIEIWQETGNATKALEMMPRKFTGETSVIRHMSSKAGKEDWLGALRTIPRNLRTMYVHAYQSLVWNVVVSERWSRYGDKVIKGDLVLVNDDAAADEGNKDEVDENGEVVVHPAAHDTAVQVGDIYERARALTTEEAESGRYTIFDIVLPLPGFDVEYPDNDIGEYYKEFMGSERGGGLDPANMRRSVKDFSLSGSYRKFIARLDKDISFEVRKYHTDTEQMVETDLDKIMKARPNDRSQNRDQNSFYGQASRPQHSNGRNQGRNFTSGRGNNHNQDHHRGKYTDVRLENNQNNFGNGISPNQDHSRSNYTDISLENNQNNFGNGNSPNQDHSRSKYTDIRLENNQGNGQATATNGSRGGFGSTYQGQGNRGPHAAPFRRSPPREFPQASVAKLSAWQSLPDKLKADDKAAAAAADLKKLTEAPIDPDSIMQPAYEETYIQHKIHDDVRQRVTKVKEVIAAGGVRVEAKSDVAPATPSGSGHLAADDKVESPADKVESAETSFVESDGGVKLNDDTEGAVAGNGVGEEPQPATKTDFPVNANTKSSEENEAMKSSTPEKLGPAKIAVVLKFQLGSSQYATMALRELMKSGGVKTYKPDFSNGRA